MRTLHVQTRSGADRIVNLDIPVEAPNAAYDVVIVVQPRTDASTPVTAEERGWPAGFFDATPGAWKGEFVRDQGQFEGREEASVFTRTR